jgi:hypothetical protein
MVIVSMVLLILGLVIGGFLSTCYNSGCGQVSNITFFYLWTTKKQFLENTVLHKQHCK